MLQAVESFLTESTDTVSTVVATAATPVNPLPVAEATTTESISLWELCMEGGWIMIPLAIGKKVVIRGGMAIRRDASTFKP